MSTEPVPKNYSVPTVISSKCKTPLLRIRFATVFRPFYYPSTPEIPRYSITLLLSPEHNAKTISSFESIEHSEKIYTLLKKDYHKKNGEKIYSGNLLIKFQSKEKIPVYHMSHEEPMKLDKELHPGGFAEVEYDLIRYTKKIEDKEECGLNLRPTRIYFQP